MDADGTNRRHVASNAFQNGPVAWSPNSVYLAYARGSSLEVAQASGTVVDTWARGNISFPPAWSPDGRAMAFFVRSSGIHVVAFGD